MGDLGRVENGGERTSALGSELVIPKTVSEAQGGNGERAGVSMGADRKANSCLRLRPMEELAALL